MNKSVVYIATSILVVSTTAWAEPAKISGTVTEVFGPRFVVETATGKILVDIGPKGAEKVTIKSGEKIEIEGDQNVNELHARRVTLSDGHAYELGKPGKTWREWLGGTPSPDAMGFFGPTEAKKLASEKGYQVSGDPVPAKKHFRVMASKDGKNYELDVHRDGNIIEHLAFGVAEAKKLAADKGYELTGEPVATKKHFRVSATKGGKTYEIDLHRDGNVVEHLPFGVTEVKKLVGDNGYELIGELRPVDEHFELLGKKDGKFYELHAHRDGKLVRDRLVVASDPKWGPSLH
jgi:hypothetical protein